jgi:hypothetical protein
LISSYSFLSHACSLSNVEEWLPDTMANSSTKSLLLSSTLSLIIDVMSALLDDDDRDETERFHVTTFETCCAVSTEKIKLVLQVNIMIRKKDNQNPVCYPG